MPCRLASPSFCLHTNILEGVGPSCPLPCSPDPASPVTHFPPASISQTIPQQGALCGCRREDLPAGSCSLPPSWSRGDEVREGLGRTFCDKGLTSSSSQAGQPSTTESPAVSCLTGRCCVDQAARVCVWPLPWECCGSASQVRGAEWGLEVGEEEGTTPTKSLCLAGLGRFWLTSSQSPLCPVHLVPTSGIQQATYFTFLASVFSLVKW